MSKTSVITTRVALETAQALDGLAERTGRTRASIVAEAIRDYTQEQAAFLDFIEEGDRDIDEGRFYTQEEMEVWLKEKIATAQAAVEAKKANAA
jgi:predicted transcriptional regulator